MNAADIVDRYRVSEGKGFHLADHDPGDTAGLDIDKKQAQSLLQLSVQRLSELQEKLYAQDRWAVLLIFQAMDAAGKDSTIKHVMSGVNPQGVEVHAFKQPSAEDLDHDFLWRACDGCRNAAGSASSTAPTMRRSWSSGSTRRSCAPRSCRPSW